MWSFFLVFFLHPKILIQLISQLTVSDVGVLKQGDMKTPKCAGQRILQEVGMELVPWPPHTGSMSTSLSIPEKPGCVRAGQAENVQDT